MTIIDKNHDISQWFKQNKHFRKHFRRITGIKYSALHVIKK